MRKIFLLISVFGLLLGASITSQAQTNLVPDSIEFKVLKNIYDSLGGSTWTTKTNWPASGSWPSSATASQFGTWYGITVANGDISTIAFGSNNLQGKIPRTIVRLSALKILAIYSNTLLTSDIPSLTGLSNLQTLQLYGNRLTGSIPTSLSNLTALVTVDLHGNTTLNGNIPTGIGNLTLATTLDLSGNALTGTIPDGLGNAVKLTLLYLYNNHLTGSIPPSLSNLSQVVNLDISGNSLTGSLPVELANLSKLVNVSFAYNQLTGQLPSVYSYLSKLASFNVSANQLTGPIPDSYGSLTNIVNFYIQDNKISGLLPTSMGNWTKLQYFYASRNKLTGTIPSSFGSMTQLVLFYVDSNLMSGSLPSNIGNWTHLSLLNLYGNSFSGAVPASIGSCTALSYLRLDNNKFASIPAGINSLPAIYSLGLGNNELNSIPNFGSHVNHANLSVVVTNNRLDFSMLEPSVGAIYSFAYNPQKTINDVATTTYSTSGGSLVITARPTGSFSSVTWDKQQANGTWASVTSLDQDAVAQTFTRTSPTSSDDGKYRWNMTNTKATGFTLQSDPITIKSQSATALDNWAFQYKYDGRNRMTAKKVPGSDWVYMVYDKRDRLVLTQDANQRAVNKWAFTKYDSMNRPILTGVRDTTTALTQDQMQAVVDAYYNKTSARWGEGYVGNKTGNVHGYTNRSYPVRTGTTNTEVDLTKFYTASYFDNYKFVTDLAGSGFNYVTGDLTGQDASNPAVKGHPTGSKTIVLETTTFLWSATYYDAKYRTIQGIASNNKSGTDRVTNTVDFLGKVLQSKKTHTVSISGSNVTHTVQTVFDYDHQGRVINEWYSVDGGPQILLTKNEYNELGQVVDKKLHSEEASTVADNQRHFKQSIDYAYNIRGWLTHINNSDVNSSANHAEDDSNTGQDLFGMELGYNQDLGTGNAAIYNGNISSMKWSSNLGLDVLKERAYNFNYDALNRLLGATHRTKAANWANSSAFHENSLTYDGNGNILTLKRYDKNGSLMDDLTYDYGTGASRSNQLLGVADGGDFGNGFVDGNSSGADYTYDANGNMNVDNNKKITGILYNHLNLPKQVTISTGEYLKYTYDATGRKLNQSVYNSSNALQKSTDYDEDFIYENNVLQFINHPEGRIVMTGASPEYQYHLKDHLGSVRMTFTANPGTDLATGTLETVNTTTEQGQFLRYTDAKLVYSAMFDHTNGSSAGVAQRLNGSANEKFGLARSLSVMPGDKIQMEVYAKYVDPVSTNWNTALATLMSQISSSASGVVTDGSAYSSSTSTFPAGFAGLQTTSSNGAPKAFLNWLVFDRNYSFISGGFQQITTAAKESGTDIAHERVAPASDLTITQPGYVYIYLSNEETTPMEVYFDDFKVTQVKSMVVQEEDFYPFGLKYNSFSREGSLLNTNKLFQNQEHVDDLGLNWEAFKWRNHQPDIGRFFGVDKLADSYYYNSPYAFSENKVTGHIELEGLEAVKTNQSPGDDSQQTLAKASPMSFMNNTPPTAQVVDDNQSISPVKDPVINSEQGPRTAPTPGASTNHKGIDIVNLGGTSGKPVVAPLNGKIVSITSKADGNHAGNRITIRANKDNKTHNFFHLQDTGFGAGLTAGDPVVRGQQIGRVGQTGLVTGPHLHYEVQGTDGSYLNPRNENSGLRSAPNPAEAAAAAAAHAASRIYSIGEL